MDVIDIIADLSLHERTFGHCIVTWVIKDYLWSLFPENVEVSTSAFPFAGPGSHVTRWKLIAKCEFGPRSLLEKLKVNIQSETNEAHLASISNEQENFDMKISEDDEKRNDFSSNDKKDPAYPIYPIKNITLRLERIETSEGPSDIWVNWKVFCLSQNGEKLPLSHEERCFYKGQVYGFNIGTIYDLKKHLEYNFDEITIVCDMVVKNRYTDMYSNESVPIDMESLSKDLQWIFNEKISCDAQIKLDNQKIMVHKAILCSQSSYFDELFKNEDSNVIEVSDINYDEMLKILRYIYTYDLKDVIGDPSVGVYEAATLMKLKKLTAHYTPEEYKMRTVLDIKKVSFLWTIENIKTDDNCRSSPIFPQNFGDSTWQIHLYPKGTDCETNCESEYVAIVVKCIEGDFYRDLRVRCAVYNDGKFSFWKVLQKTESNVYEEKNFISLKDVANFPKDSLTLGLKIGMFKAKETFTVYKPCSPVLSSIKTSFDDMSNNMLSLFRSNKHADVSLKIKGKEINAHSYILSARSYLLSKMLKERTSLILSNVSPEILDVLLVYMYCSVFNVTDIEKIIDVYRAAEEFLIPSLQDKCSLFLQNNVIVKEVCSILRLAHSSNDKYLKRTVLDFQSSDETKFIEYMIEKLKIKSNLLSYEASQSEDVTSKEVSLESTSKEMSLMKYNEKAVESYDPDLSSNIEEETAEKKSKFQDSKLEKLSSDEKFKFYLINPNNDDVKNSLQRIEQLPFGNSHEDVQNKVDTISNNSQSTGRTLPGEGMDRFSAQGSKNKGVTGITCQFETVASRILFLNENTANEDEISFTCKLASTVHFNKEETCVKENVPAAVNK